MCGKDKDKSRRKIDHKDWLIFQKKVPQIKIL